jgi:hypothetical protein
VILSEVDHPAPPALVLQVAEDGVSVTYSTNKLPSQVAHLLRNLADQIEAEMPMVRR